MRPDAVASQLTKLTGTGQSFSADPGHDTSGRSLTGQDIAASISYANLDRLQYLAALYVNARDHTVLIELKSRLEESLETDIKREAKVDRWKTGSDGLIKKMVELAISEALEPHRCPTCHGVKHLQRTVAGALLPCEDCGATGNLSITNAYRAKVLGLGIETYKKYWQPRYNKLYDWIAAIPNTALEKIGRRL